MLSSTYLKCILFGRFRKITEKVNVYLISSGLTALILLILFGRVTSDSDSDRSSSHGGGGAGSGDGPREIGFGGGGNERLSLSEKNKLMYSVDCLLFSS